MGLLDVKKRIALACQRVARDPDEVTLVAVTKNHTPEDIAQAILQHGHTTLGENRVQEWRGKQSATDALIASPINWHMIGNLQTNKVKYCKGFACIHSLNSTRLADALSGHGEKHGHTFQVLVEVNIAGELSKQGAALSDAEALVAYARTLPQLQVIGLMTMAPFVDDPEEVRPVFSSLRELGKQLDLSHLSMGMSNDFEIAIEEGATIVRVGSAIFN